jgi:cation:H+ antiporter
VALAGVAFLGGGVVSLATGWLLVTRLERIGERLGFSEALLGVVAALAADAPEITASVSALSQHQRAIGAGVVIGSNAFNLAALLGLGALVSGGVSLHRRVVILGGGVATGIALCCVGATTGALNEAAALVMAGVVLTGYVAALGMRRGALQRVIPRRRAARWLTAAIHEEELELSAAIRPVQARALDFATAFGALVAVVLSSIAMERGASSLGAHWHVADAVVGGVVLAALTSLPNAVAGVHLAATGRGAAALSTALTSNNLNVVVGLLIPGAVVGLAAPSTVGSVSAWTYLALTMLVLGFAYAAKGLTRRAGATVITGYVGFVVAILLLH